MQRPVPYIEFRNVSVRYSEEVVGLKEVSLAIGRGEFVFFLGPTGAGKSTLLKLLTRDVHETSGAVTFDGQNLGAVADRNVPELRRKMGIVPQDFALLPRKRVWENVAYAMRAIGNTRREVRRKWPEILELVRMGHRVDAFPHQLSGGEQQRVAIARALIHRPLLLLADEPTGNLDPHHSWEIMELLLQLHRAGTTILVASHDMMVVERLRGIARIVTLEGGRVVSDEKPGEAPASLVAAHRQEVLNFVETHIEVATILESDSDSGSEDALDELDPTDSAQPALAEAKDA